MRVLVLGGYGVFGSLVSRELARRGHTVTVAGRSAERARKLASDLGGDHRTLPLDLRDGPALRRALEAHAAVASCAGPFEAESTRQVLEACLDGGCHYADIADDRGSVRVVRAHGPRFTARGRAALYGCSSLPGISAALAVTAAAGAATAPQRARVTLFIGNDNPKGAAAIASLLRQGPRPILAPQGALRAGGGCARVALPAPVGPRTACDFDGAEHDVLPALLSVRHVEVKVAFELRLVSCALALIGRVAHGARTARWLSALGGLTRRFGTSGGAVMVELWWPDGAMRRAAVIAERDGQRMAALPCALALDAIARGAAATGALLAHELLGCDDLLGALAREGFSLMRD